MSEAVTANWKDDPLRFIAQALFATFGAGTPVEQMTYSLILGVGAWISTALSFGATALLVVLFTVTFFIGALRFAYAEVRS